MVIRVFLFGGLKMKKYIDIAKAYLLFTVVSFLFFFVLNSFWEDDYSGYALIIFFGVVYLIFNMVMAVWGYIKTKKLLKINLLLFILNELFFLIVSVALGVPNGFGGTIQIILKSLKLLCGVWIVVFLCTVITKFALWVDGKFPSSKND